MKNNTKNSIITLAIVAVLILTTVIYLKIYQNKDIAYIIETKKTNFLSSEKITAISGLKNKTIEVNKVKQGFDNFYIDRNNMLGFIETLEKIASENQVELIIDNVGVDETHLKDAFPYGVLNMTLTASTKDFNSTVKFLADLEKLPYVIDFINVKLLSTIGEKGDVNSVWNISVTITGITN